MESEPPDHLMSVGQKGSELYYYTIDGWCEPSKIIINLNTKIKESVEAIVLDMRACANLLLVEVLRWRINKRKKSKNG